jgi:5-methylcytosine-specific restriction endonuclease McrA
VHELLVAAGGKSKSDIERLVAERFPRAEVSARVEPIAAGIGAAASSEHAPGHVADADSQGVTVAVGAPAQPLHARVAPLSAHAFAVQFTRSRDADERFRYLQDLLGHQVSRGDIAEAYDRAVRALIEKMERVRFGACERPRAVSAGSSDDPRHISAHVKRQVWKRDGGQCTFVSESGHRCEARGDVEFDHVTEVARGGGSTVDNVRLRCRGHNQHTAERTFGAGFMKQKREEAAAARGAAKAAKERARGERAAEAERTRLEPHQMEVLPWLEQLGCRKDESRIAVERCREMADAPLEDRVKSALSWFGARIGRTVSYAPAT